MRERTSRHQYPTRHTPPNTAKEEKPDTSFAGLYGALLINADGSGKKVKHSAELKDSSEDDWLGVWDAKNKVIKRINEDGSETDEVYESFGDFGTGARLSATAHCCSGGLTGALRQGGSAS